MGVPGSSDRITATAARSVALAGMPQASGLGDTGHTRWGSHLCGLSRHSYVWIGILPVWKERHELSA
jgi:hypothetical protein